MAKGIQIPTVQTGLEASISDAAKRAGPISLSASIDPSSFKRLAQPLGKVSGLATEFEKSIAASNARVIAFGASVGIINGIQNAFTDLVRTTVQVEKSLANIAAISGKTVDELKPFGKELFNIARQTSQSFETASQAALEFSRQGLSVEETLKRTTDALTLTRFTTLSAAEAVDVLTAAANSFSDSGITTAEIINKLVAVDTKFAVSAEDLANGLARAGSIAQEVGVSFDELNAAITVAQERTARGGAVIGNALKTIFTRLRSDETVQALRSIGVESLNAQGGLKGAVPLLQEVANQIKNLSEGERIQILEAIASKYNINILSALLNDLNAANSKFADVVGISAGASNEAYKRQIELNKILDSQINAVTVSVKQLFNTLGQIGVTENLSKLLEFVNNLLTSLNKILDSESTGGRIAQGLIKGLSDVLFTVGLPLLGAIFIKLTKDIAQFGVESLKTILGINQQVRERQALEQAVVNTLIRDQEIMATILSLSGNRAKQEEYLLGVYNRQLAALQQVQNIAASVAPALQAGGLSATSGRVQRRAAGGYLPNQEASDVRRGVGGAGPSSKVVSIPNFAFGGGKRGTMVANTSEYIVPNFANGGSAIFNQDMVKAYGLPAGARKISAAGGYIPNFAELNPNGKYAALVGQTTSALGGTRTERKWVTEKDKKINIFSSGFQGADSVTFDVYGVPDKNEAELKKVKKTLENDGKNLAINLAQGVSGGALPDDVVRAKLAATFNPGSLDSFSNTVFEASVGALLSDKSFKDYTEQAVTSAFDLNIAGNNLIKKSFGIKSPVEALEVKGNSGPKLMEGVARKIYQVSTGERSAFSKAKSYIENPNRADKRSIARTFTENGQTYIETSLGVFDPAGAGFNPNRYDPVNNRPAAAIVRSQGRRGALGYIPNFAAGGPLEDAIKREMAAGISPNKIRVTQDGRLRNSQNPQGLAVINTRDEPNGKIPNFAERYPAGTVIDGQQVGGRFATKEQLDALNKVTKATENTKIGLDKLFYALGGLSLVANSLESTFKDTDSSLAKFSVSLGNVLQRVSQGALLGGTVRDMGEAFGAKGILGKITSRGSLIGAGVGLALEVKDIIDTVVNAPRNAAIQKFSEARTLNVGVEEAEQGADSPTKRLELAQKRLAAQAATKAAAEQQKAALDQRYAVKVSSVGEYAFAEAPQIPEEDAKKIAELGNQILQTTTEIADERAYIAKLEKESKIYAAAQARSAQETKKAEEEARRNITNRISLEKEIAGLQEDFAKGANKISLQRIRERLAENKANIFLSESDRERLSLLEDLKNVENEIEDTKNKSVETTIVELSKLGSLVSVNRDSLKTLKDRVAQTGILGNLEAEVAALGFEGSTAAQTVLNNQRSALNVAIDTLETRREGLRLVKEDEIQNKRIIEAEKIRSQAISQRIFLQDKERESLQRYSADISEIRRGSQLGRVQAEIAAQPFATPEQKGLELRLSRETRVESERSRAQTEAASQRENAVKNLRDQYLATVESLKYLDAADKERLKGTVDQINKIENLNERYRQLSDLINAIPQYRVSKSSPLFDPQASEQSKKAQEEYVELLGFAQRELERINKIEKERLQTILDIKSYEEEINDIRQSKGGFAAGSRRAFDDLRKESAAFSEEFAYNTTYAFRDGLKDALGAAISQTDDLNTALQNVAINFLKRMQDALLNETANNLTFAIKKGFSGAGKDSGESILSSIGSSISKFFTGSNGGFVKGYASGGLVTGGSGYKDDVPARLSSGEYVLRQSAVKKYGVSNLEKLNSGGMGMFAAGGFFLPGVRGQTEISGYKDLTAFAKQTTTSGATDVLMGGRSTAFANLEDQSQRLSAYALLNEDDIINQEIRSAQEQALNVIKEREAYRTQQRKAFQSQLKQTAISALLNFGAGALTKGIGSLAATGASKAFGSEGVRGASPFKDVNITGGYNLGPTAFGKTSDLIKQMAASKTIPMTITPSPFAKTMGRAYGGMINRYNAGGPTDDVPALLMGGEYVMSRQATKKYGRQFFDSLNQGRTPRFADGGQVSTSEPSFAEKASAATEAKTDTSTNVSININVTGGTADTQTQGNTKQGGVDYKKMGEQIKQIVIQTINEEKRLGGSLRSR